MNLCMHAWVYTVEATDPPEPGPNATSPPARAATGNACFNDLVQAAAVELLHNATLVHDDVLDEADTRRRGRTVRP